MKKIVLTLVALMALTVAQAQDENGERRGPRRMDPQQMMQNMEKELNLTAEQKTKFTDVMKEQQAEMQRHQEEMK
jgi:Spy/CpxP family protein refolding chaperone